jgi:DNA-binding NarL/FixJ family response regulator
LTSDELRDTLNTIRGYAHILQEHREVLVPQEIEQAAGAIEEQSERGLQALDAAETEVVLTLVESGPEGVPYGLSARERQVLTHLTTGLGDKQIAALLGISTYTVSKHVGSILAKMNATSRTEAGVRALREGLL